MTIKSTIRKRRKAARRWIKKRTRRVLIRIAKRNQRRAQGTAPAVRRTAAAPVRQAAKPVAPKASAPAGPAAVKRKADGKFNGSKSTQSAAAAKKAAARKSAATSRILLASNKRVARTDARLDRQATRNKNLR